MKKSIFAAIASMLMVLASATSVFACGWLMYQPKAPKALQK
ncbi:cyclic lactone autoinducer peptide [Desulfosporosinus sp.]|nr:cyclic lactone autoinducer peptide [Desulfosporosinus sp.]MBC2723678.1 cyclic lactone autoinducer peptide [Desulfosporosinus sp.]MBC2726522.1 cyclic lactone autoinducer peptide [Desulfosporosinus sp.]